MDGIPLFRSSREQLWPILGQIKNFRPFVVALFSGKSKPKSINQYLNNFVIELNNLHVVNQIGVYVYLTRGLTDSGIEKRVVNMLETFGEFIAVSTDFKSL